MPSFRSWSLVGNLKNATVGHYGQSCCRHIVIKYPFTAEVGQGLWLLVISLNKIELENANLRI